MDNKIIILPFSRRKIVISLLGGSLLAIFGGLAALKPDTFNSPFIRSPELIRFWGIAGFCFFGIGVFFVIRKLFDSKQGLIIDEQGITNNTNAFNIGLIAWSDIIRIEKRQVMSTKLLLLHVRNPHKYLQRTKSIFLKRLIKINIKTYGTPIAISSTSLKISFEDLETIIIREKKGQEASELFNGNIYRYLLNGGEATRLYNATNK